MIVRTGMAVLIFALFSGTALAQEVNLNDVPPPEIFGPIDRWDPVTGAIEVSGHGGSISRRSGETRIITSDGRDFPYDRLDVGITAGLVINGEDIEAVVIFPGND